MEITDSQIHVWAPDTPSTPWTAAGAEYAHGPSLGVQDVRSAMAAAGVHGALLIPPSWPVDGNGFALSAAEQFPDAFRVMARVDLTTFDPAAIAALRRSPSFVGIRMTFTRGDAVKALHDESLDWVWAAIQDLGLPTMVAAFSGLQRVGQIARRHPGLRLAVDHFGLRKNPDEAQFDADVNDLLRLSALPNVAVKASALPTYTDQSYPFGALHAPVTRVIDAFGPDRVFWGSDLSRLTCPYRHCVTLFTEELKLSDEDLPLIMGRALRNWIGW
jgi:L-fuconolactonase